MKKKIILIAVILIGGLLILTGCGNNTNNVESKNSEGKQAEAKDNTVVKIGDETFKLKNETELYDIHYRENYVDFHTDRIGNTKMMNYTQNGNLAFEVRVNCDENRSVSELKAIVEVQFKATEKTKEVNGVKYIYYEYTTENGETVHHYIYAHNGKVYSIGFFLGENPGNIEEVFMNNVSFK